MNLKNSTIVEEALNINFPEGNGALNLNLRDVISLAVRHNPKRAHLLVSKVLGKHIPTDPQIVTMAGRLLGCMVGNVLDGENPWNELEDATKGLKIMLAGHSVEYTLGSDRVYDAMTIGYAETATSLGFLVAQALNTPYIHSTRSHDGIGEIYGHFEEEHSHATSHQLIPKDRSLLDNERTIVLVDDEISTGLTLMNTIEELQAIASHKSYVIASLIDCRTQESIVTMQEFAERLNISIEVVSLVHGEVHLPDDVLAKGAEFIKNIENQKTEKLLPAKVLPEINIIDVALPYFDHLHHGVENTNEYERLAEAIVLSLDTEEYENILFLGLEESMALPLLIAEKLRGQVRFSTTTRSPVIPYDHEEYAIRSAITFQVPVHDEDNPQRFAYNLAGGFNEVIIISEPGHHIHDIINGENDLIHALAGITPKITIINLKEKSE